MMSDNSVSVAQSQWSTGVSASVKDHEPLVCPSCASDALYRYGRTKQGKQRFRCILCGRQFIEGSKAKTQVQRPLCLECGKRMHIYKIEEDGVRFRCSGYPRCRTFRKISTENPQ